MTVTCRPAYFRAERPGRWSDLRRDVFRAPVTLLFAASCGLASAQQLSLTLDNVESPAFALTDLKVELRGDGSAAVSAGTVRVGAQQWRDMRITCTRLQLTSGRVDCPQGVIDAGGKSALSFTFDTRRKDVSLQWAPAPDESWHLELRGETRGQASTLIVNGGRAERLNAWLPEGLPRLRAGRLNGRLASSAGGRWTLDAATTALAFSDASGLRAAENVAARLDAQAQQTDGRLRWRASLSWDAGELFWQPMYLRAAAQRLTVEGDSDDRTARVIAGRLEFPTVGRVAFDGEWAHAARTVSRARLRGDALELSALYERVLKAFVDGTVLSDLRAEGRVDIALAVEGGAMSALDLRLDNVSVEDRQRRFALFGVNGLLPWHRENATEGQISAQGGELLRIAFGALTLPIGMRGQRFRFDPVELPLLDGTLVMKGFAADRPDQGWRWAFGGELTSVSMERFTQALGLPTMHGRLSAKIPRVSYDRSTLKVDGALVFDVFDGTATVEKLVLTEPFGRAPRLNADLDARNIDLDLLTRTFSFGNITGRVDAAVRGLELVNWEPVRFDARIASAAGDYPRKISQNAVQNISALGGAGAAAALQRTFLRFFDQFGYDRLGVSCVLADGVCRMSGVEPAPQGYVIVKGGGVPAISVIGYNRSVNWRELVARLKRIVQDNVKAVIR